MRKFIVKHFALYYRVTLFGKTFNALRCTRIGFPLFLLTGIVIATDPLYPALQWYDLSLLSLFAVYLWMTFDWLGVGYFALWPVKRHELDKEQKRDFDIYMIRNKI